MFDQRYVHRAPSFAWFFLRANLFLSLGVLRYLASLLFRAPSMSCSLIRSALPLEFCWEEYTHRPQRIPCFFFLHPIRHCHQSLQSRRQIGRSHPSIILPHHLPRSLHMLRHHYPGNQSFIRATDEVRIPFFPLLQEIYHFHWLEFPHPRILGRYLETCFLLVTHLMELDSMQIVRRNFDLVWLWFRPHFYSIQPFLFP